MKHSVSLIGVAVPPGGGTLWHERAVEALGARGVAIDWAAGDLACHPVPMPWRALLGIERLATRPATDFFASRGLPVTPLDRSAPDMLVLPPGARADEALLARLPMGVLEFDPVTPAAMTGGVLEGRMFWRRAGFGARLAMDTATCVQGPFPLGWAGPHLAKTALMPARFLDRLDAFAADGQTGRGVAVSGAGLAGSTSRQVAGTAPGSAMGDAAGIAPGAVEAYWESLPEAEPSVPHVPSLLDWAGFAASLAGFGLKRAWLDLLHHRQWYLAARPGDGNPARPGFASEPFRPVLPPRGTGWADPILVRHDGRTWLFIEEIPGKKKGVISVMEVLPGKGSANGHGAGSTQGCTPENESTNAAGVRLGPVRRVLTEPFHLSYPNVFEHDGSMYMVPESAQAGQVRLYRAEDFPGGWVLDRVLLDGVPAMDATFLEHGGLWWLFCSVRPSGGSSWDELHLYWSADRFGPYEPHPLNPVVSDVRRARPAGPVIRSGGRLLRPAQDCSGWYGRALSVMEITRLDREGYAEIPAARLTPDLVPGSFCLHTFVSAEGVFEFVDGQRFVFLLG